MRRRHLRACFDEGVNLGGLVNLHTLVIFILRAGDEAIFLGAVEDGEQAVVVALQQWIGFMIVAAGAAEREAEEDAACGGNDIIELVGTVLGERVVVLAHVVIIARAIATEASGDERLFIRAVDFIPGELLSHETGIRLVVVEAANDVITVFPGVRTVEVVVRATGVCIASEIEPVTAPALAVVGALEETVDERFVGQAVCGRGSAQCRVLSAQFP